MGLLDNGEPSEQELREMQQKMEREREQRQQEQQLAAQYSDRQEFASSDDLLAMVTDLGLDSDLHGDHLQEYLASELSHIYALSHFTPGDIDQFDWRSEQDAWLARNELSDPDSGLDADDERMMFGEESPKLTDTKARRLRSAQSAKKALLRLARNGEFRRSMTEIRAVSQSSNADEGEGDDDGGFLSGLV